MSCVHNVHEVTGDFKLNVPARCSDGVSVEMCVAMCSRFMKVQCLSKMKLVQTWFYYLSYSIFNDICYATLINMC